MMQHSLCSRGVFLPSLVGDGDEPFAVSRGNRLTNSIPSTPCGSRGLRSQARGLAAGRLSEAPGIEEVEDAIAIDGESPRGSKKQGAPGAHLLSALARRVGLTLAQQAGDD